MEVNRLAESKNRDDEALHVTMSSGGRQMQIQNDQVGVFQSKGDPRDAHEARSWTPRFKL